MTIQITIIKIEGYGPWTLKLGSDREAQLQMFQASFYSDLQNLFNKRNSILYFNRFDELIAITNGLSIDDHLFIEQEINDMYKGIEISMTIGIGETPLDANIAAHRSRKNNNLVKKVSWYMQVNKSNLCIIIQRIYRWICSLKYYTSTWIIPPKLVICSHLMKLRQELCRCFQ